jgi:hypothetical protein
MSLEAVYDAIQADSAPAAESVESGAASPSVPAGPTSGTLEDVFAFSPSTEAPKSPSEPAAATEEVEAASDDAEVDEVLEVGGEGAELEDVVEAQPVKKSKGSERYQQLANKNRELQEQLAQITQAQQNQQLAQLENKFTSALQQLQQENQRLNTQLQSFSSSKEEEQLTDVERALRAEVQKQFSPLLQQLEAEKQARASEQQKAQQEQARLQQEQQAFEFGRLTRQTVEEKILTKLDDKHRKSVADPVTMLTLGLASIEGIDPVAAAAKAEQLLEAYHVARTEAKKAVVKQKLQASKASAPVVTSTGVPTKQAAASSNYSIDQLRDMGYEGTSVQVLFAAAKNGYKRLR